MNLTVNCIHALLLKYMSQDYAHGTSLTFLITLILKGLKSASGTIKILFKQESLFENKGHLNTEYSLYLYLRRQECRFNPFDIKSQYGE